eukprot:15066342-Alexandrium_andersonii.AAC.1
MLPKGDYRRAQVVEPRFHHAGDCATGSAAGRRGRRVATVVPERRSRNGGGAILIPDVPGASSTAR